MLEQISLRPPSKIISMKIFRLTLTPFQWRSAAVSSGGHCKVACPSCCPLNDSNLSRSKEDDQRKYPDACKRTEPKLVVWWWSEVKAGKRLSCAISPRYIASPSTDLVLRGNRAYRSEERERLVFLSLARSKIASPRRMSFCSDTMLSQHHISHSTPGREGVPLYT